MNIFYYFINVFLAYILSDLLIGIYHWIKDSYFSPYTPIIGKIFIWNSRLHHIKPKYITEFSNQKIFFGSAKWTLTWILPLVYLFGINVFLLVLFTIISLNDIIHKYAHVDEDKRPRIITFLQKIYILQSHDEHHWHHISPHEVNYCPITPHMNKILEYLNFWKYSENMVEKYIGIAARSQELEYIVDPSYAAGIKFVN